MVASYGYGAVSRRARWPDAAFRVGARPPIHEQKRISMRRILLVTGLALALGTGCRTYGGYRSEALTVRAVEVAATDFERQLGRARIDLALLEDAADRDPSLLTSAGRLAELVRHHEVLAAAHRELAVRLSGSRASYRHVSREYLALVSEQEIIRRAYRQLLEDIAAGPGTMRSIRPSPGERYASVPPHYDRTNNTRRLTMEAILAGRIY